MSDASVCGPIPTLPDLLAPALDVVFIGINPSLYSVERGHYFARPTNRFWSCLSRSVLSLAARTTLGVSTLGPQHDRGLLDFGIGFTDVVKRPTVRAADVDSAEFVAGVGVLLSKLERFAPRVACFHGVTGYRHVHKLLSEAAGTVTLGLQELRVGPTRFFVLPNPSGANAHVTPAQQVTWYDRLAACSAELTGRALSHRELNRRPAGSADRATLR